MKKCVILICLCIVCGCNAYRTIDSVGELSRSAAMTLTNYVQPSLTTLKILMSNDIPVTLTKLRILEEVSISTLSNLNNRIEKLELTTAPILLTLNSSLNIVNTNLPVTFSNANILVKSIQNTVTNLNTMISHTDEVVMNFKKNQEKIDDKVETWSDWFFKFKIYVYITLGLLSTYAFRKNNILDDIKIIYNKCKLFFIRN